MSYKDGYTQKRCFVHMFARCVHIGIRACRYMFYNTIAWSWMCLPQVCMQQVVVVSLASPRCLRSPVPVAVSFAPCAEALVPAQRRDWKARLPGESSWQKHIQAASTVDPTTARTFQGCEHTDGVLVIDIVIHIYIYIK